MEKDSGIVIKKGPLFLPFPKETSTLLVSVSNGGKSFFLSKVLQHADVYFEVPISKVYIINHNKNVVFYDLQQFDSTKEVALDWDIPPVEEYVLGEFDVINDAEPNSVVIFEDIQFVSPELLNTINLACHHKHLCHVFVVAQSVLGGNIFKLLSLVHRVILFTSSGGITRLANYITQHFSTSSENKTFLKHIIDQPKRVPYSTLQIEVNNYQSSYLATANLLGLVYKDIGFCTIYPKPGFGHLYKQASIKVNQGMSIEWEDPELIARALSTQLEESTASEQHLEEKKGDVEKPVGYLIIHPALIKNIAAVATVEDKSSNQDDGEEACLSKDNVATANRVRNFLYSNIESLLKKQRHLVAKGLVNELLANPDFCISLDGKRIKLHNTDDVTSVSTVDFIATASRPSGPSEQLTVFQKNFVALTESLINNGAPRTLIKNKLLFGQSNKPKTAAAAAQTRQRRATSKRKTSHYTAPHYPSAYYSGPFYQHQAPLLPPPPHLPPLPSSSASSSPWTLN